jgi:DNA-binding response OmpR family regulator
MGEVKARVSAVLRRATNVAVEQSDTYVDDVIIINYTSQTVAVRGEPTDLTPTVYKFLTILVNQKGRPNTSRSASARCLGT